MPKQKGTEKSRECSACHAFPAVCYLLVHRNHSSSDHVIHGKLFLPLSEHIVLSLSE